MVPGHSVASQSRWPLIVRTFLVTPLTGLTKVTAAWGSKPWYSDRAASSVVSDLPAAAVGDRSLKVPSRAIPRLPELWPEAWKGRHRSSVMGGDAVRTGVTALVEAACFVDQEVVADVAPVGGDRTEVVVRPDGGRRVAVAVRADRVVHGRRLGRIVGCGEFSVPSALKRRDSSAPHSARVMWSMPRN